MTSNEASWGKIIVLKETAEYSCKEITVYAGKQFNLVDYIGHDLDGTWHCVSGRGTITIRSDKKSISLYDNDLNLREFRCLDPEEDIHLLCWQYSNIVILECIRKKHL